MSRMLCNSSLVERFGRKAACTGSRTRSHQGCNWRNRKLDHTRWIIGSSAIGRTSVAVAEKPCFGKGLSHPFINGRGKVPVCSHKL
eukprot:5984697-Amphidinium_carterae.1